MNGSYAHAHRWKRNGTTPAGAQRHRCIVCGRTTTDKDHESPARQWMKARLALFFVLIDEGWSLRRAAGRSQISTITAATYLATMRKREDMICGCGRQWGHRDWCEWRIARSEGRRRYLDDCSRQSKAVAAKREPAERLTEYYPFVPRRANGDEVVLAVNAAVSKSFPPEMRADICQDMLVDILQGVLELDGIQSCVSEYIARYRKNYDGARFISIDAVDSFGHTLAERLVG